MPVKIACITGEEIQRQIQTGTIKATSIGQRQTPFGTSGEIFQVKNSQSSYYLLSRYKIGKQKTSPGKVNYRANIYALKELDVRYILGWGSGGAVTHNITVGDLIILSDVIDFTRTRQQTFFENHPYGYLRQFPVFCPKIKQVLDEVLHNMKLVYHGASIAAVTEGPRLETPAEINYLSTTGSEIVTHTFVPEMFLARELQMCYAAVCYVVNYAETGSRQQPFIGGGLFGEEISNNKKLSNTISSIHEIINSVAEKLSPAAEYCECVFPMSQVIKTYKLDTDWKTWFE